MNKLMEALRGLALRFLNFLVITLVLAAGLGIVFISGAFISNVANAFRLGGYIDPLIGVQVVLVSLTMVWIPLLIVAAIAKR